MYTTTDKDKQLILQVYSPNPITFVAADGMYLIDESGKYYLDFSAQYSACSLGHCNKELNLSIQQQLDKLVSVTSMFISRERTDLADKLIELAPRGLRKVLFGCTGSDANEFALKCAKHFKRGGKIVTFYRGFHGSTAGSAGATGKAETIQEDAFISELLPSGFVHASPPYCYRCDFGKQAQNCGFHCLKYLEQIFLHECGGRPAAVMLEPIFASGGIIVPPQGYLQALRELCNTYDALLIFDEIVTGIGRTGTMFACEHWGVNPDILVIGKALTGGYVPGSAVLVRQDIADVMDKLNLHGHTHSNYPLMCKSALKNIEIIMRDHILEQVQDVGAYLHKELCFLANHFECIGDVRGVGLLQGFELVKNRMTKEADYELGGRLFGSMLDLGLITELESRKNLSNVVIVLHPPLIATKEDVDNAVDIINKALLKIQASTR